jgi:prepilin-type N-terminal cleavage/methylation domain-containing protein
MSFSRVPPGPGCPSGFTLIEALVALTILGVALLLGMQLLIQTPRIISRIDAERQAFRALEATLEGVRGGSVSLVDQTLKCFQTAAGTPASPSPCDPDHDPDDDPLKLKVFLDVEPADLPGLCHVTLTAHYLALKVPQKKQLETLVRGPC